MRSTALSAFSTLNGYFYALVTFLNADFAEDGSNISADIKDIERNQD